MFWTQGDYCATVKHICFPILTYLPSQQTLAYSWYHIYKHCFLPHPSGCPDLCKFERGTKLYAATKINKNVPLASHNANFDFNVKAILDARAEISYRKRTKNSMKYVSSLHFNHNFKSGSDRQIWSSKKNLIWGFSSIPVPPPSVTYINKRLRKPSCLPAAKEPGGFVAAVFILYLCSHLQ